LRISPGTFKAVVGEVNGTAILDVSRSLKLSISSAPNLFTSWDVMPNTYNVVHHDLVNESDNVIFQVEKN
jgi:hypothetical protein